MIEIQYLESFCFPWRLFSKDGSLRGMSEGSLFPAPKDTLTSDHIGFCKEANFGWSKCPVGFAAYKTYLSVDEADYLVVFGLKIRGISTQQGKTEGLSILTTREQLEIYTKRLIQAIISADDVIRTVVGSNIHEVRGINTGIYNAAYRIQESLQTNDSSEDLLQLAKSVVAMSETLHVRTGFLDAISSPEIRSQHVGNIHVYRNFDRAKRSLHSSANSNKIFLYIEGKSNGTIDGRKLFDLVPFLLLDNAIKYAPKSSRVEINIRDDKLNIYINVKSLGPLVEADEIEKIFMFAKRGRRASAMVPEGSGIGLYLLKQIVEQDHHGSVSFYQDPDSIITNDGPFYNTYFHIRLPRNDND